MGSALTNPHLELVAAALATRIVNSMVQESDIKYELIIIYWFDSLATLHLIRNKTWWFCIFVDFWLAIIRVSSCVADWKDCPTNLNTSDIGTHLIAPKNKKSSYHGWKDLNFYYRQNSKGHVCPLRKIKLKISFLYLWRLVMLKPKMIIMKITRWRNSVEFADYYSDFYRLMRSLCYVFRVIKSCLIKNLKERERFFKIICIAIDCSRTYWCRKLCYQTWSARLVWKIYFYIKSLDGNICFKVSKDLKIAFRPLKSLSALFDSYGLPGSHSRIVNADKTLWCTLSYCFSKTS